MNDLFRQLNQQSNPNLGLSQSVQQKYLTLVADNYNISDILDEQKELSKTYKEKLKKIL